MSYGRASEKFREGERIQRLGSATVSPPGADAGPCILQCPSSPKGLLLASWAAPAHVATSSLKTPWTAPCGMVTLSSAAPTFPSCNLPHGLVFPGLAAPVECELLRQEIRCLHNLCNSPPHTHTHGARHTVGAYHCLLTGTGSVMILIIGG